MSYGDRLFRNTAVARRTSFVVCVWFLNSFQVEIYRPKNYRFAEQVECVTTPVWFNLAFCPGVRT